MDLQINVKTVHVMDYDNWNRFIEEYFELPPQKYHRLYTIEAAEEITNDSIFQYKPDGELSIWDMEDHIDLLLKEKKVTNWCTRSIMNYLVQEGVLTAGAIYQIHISW